MDWQDKIIQYCDFYNIPLYYLSETLNEPKVIPMIRGKAFEFSVLERLREILDTNIWQIEKPNINAQLGLHDIDVQVFHKQTGKSICIECKLAAKGSCRVLENKKTQIKVKCMRSRTLGTEMVKNLAPKIGISENMLKVHNDQYLKDDFDFVITSIGNAFYQTCENGAFAFSPTENQMKFLKHFPGKNLKNEAFNFFLIAESKKITVRKRNKIVCSRRKCTSKKNCGFIPNYPVIEFEKDSLKISNNWHKIEDAETIFKKYLSV